MNMRTMLVAGALAALVCCSRSSSQVRTFSTPDEAVKELTAAVKDPGKEKLIAIFGPDAQKVVDAGDPGAGQRARQVFKVAVAERWHLEDQGADTKILVIGNEDWPFPIPIVKEGNGWHFDLAKGLDEILNRQIGRNELGAIRTVRTYYFAQHVYAKHDHDGKPAGLYARRFQSDPGRQNGLYWTAAHGQRPSPLGDLVAQAAAEGRTLGSGAKPTPFHGYYYKILTAQGPAATGGAKDYVVNGELSGGFALVAWPAQYGVTGIMTFIVNQDGVLREKDLGQESDAAARAMATYNPDESWTAVQQDETAATK
jgi:hypothetical protein